LYIGLQVKFQVDFSNFNESLFLWKYFGKITQMPKFKKIIPVGGKMFHSGGIIFALAERYEQGNSFFYQLYQRV